MRAAFAGTPEFALPALAALVARHTVVGVLTQPDRKRGRGLRLAPSPVKTAALAHGLPLAQPERLDAAACATLAAWRPDVVVVAAYGLLLPPAVLAVPRFGCVNVHASLLPRWRGAAPVQRAILAGDAETGVSILRMESGLDSGPVYLQRRIAISARHTAGSLLGELGRLGATALLDALAGLERGQIPTPQPREGITWAGRLSSDEARIDWRCDAREIERQVRALIPSPVARTIYVGQPLRILGARVSADQHVSDDKRVENDHKQAEIGTIVAVIEDFMQVKCGLGYLEVTEVQRAGGRVVSARDFCRGARSLGERLG